ncbi:hypothetical protein J7K74_03415, partial [Candidatus Woesearchaeota archaeon]|nr:hypothetical protein [Candidatus Woesearchaeota archaeon]
YIVFPTSYCLDEEDILKYEDKNRIKEATSKGSILKLELKNTPRDKEGRPYIELKKNRYRKKEGKIVFPNPGLYAIVEHRRAFSSIWPICLINYRKDGRVLLTAIGVDSEPGW